MDTPIKSMAHVTRFQSRSVSSSIYGKPHPGHASTCQYLHK